MSIASASEVIWKWLKLEAKLALTDPYAAWAELWETIKPGGKVHVLLVENQYHLIVELVLFVAIVYLLAQSRASPKASPGELTEEEVDELVREWKPEPLVPEQSASVPRMTTPVIDQIVGPRVTIDGTSDILHLASYNFWGLAGDPSVQKEDAKALQHYGVGSCGPRGFYGTIDAHTSLEEELATFMGAAQTIVYSFDIATVPSVLPAFTTKKDVIVMDEAASWPLRNGASLSRARVHYYKHNDMEDLERVLCRVVDSMRSMPLTRRFIVCEGISQTRGSVAPLRQIFHLKSKYKFRMVVDESLSFGVCGARGRGACEAAGLAPSDVEIITGSLGTGLASTGGFCVGTENMVDHQRLSGSGYVFSASLPPVLAVSASATLRRFQELHSAAGGGAGSGAQAGVLGPLAVAARALRHAVQSVPELRMLDVEARQNDKEDGDWVAPVVVAGLAPVPWVCEPTPPPPSIPISKRNGTVVVKGASGLPLDEELATIIRIRERLLESRVALVDVQRPSCMEEGIVEPALRLAVTPLHTPQDLEAFGLHLQEAVSAVLKEAEAASPARDAKGSVGSLKVDSGSLSS